MSQIQNRDTPRRKEERFLDPLSTLVFWRGSAGRHEAYMCDLSVSGCFLNTNADADDGENIVIEVPDGGTGNATVDITGTVIHQRRPLKGFGVRFDALEEEHTAAIRNLTAKAETQPDDRERH